MGVYAPAKQLFQLHTGRVTGSLYLTSFIGVTVYHTTMWLKSSLMLFPPPQEAMHVNQVVLIKLDHTHVERYAMQLVRQCTYCTVEPVLAAT